LKTIEERGLIEHASRLGSAMIAGLRQRLSDIEQVGEVRGLGFMQGVEFVEDRTMKRPAIALRDRIVRSCVFEQRLWVLGSGRSTIRFLPALTTTEDEAMEAVDRFVHAVEQEVGREPSGARAVAS